MVKILAKKHLGQNFLKNKKILEMIVWEATLEDISVIEVWPGPGDLTQEILRRKPKNLTLIELDADMIPLLLERFSDEAIWVYQNDVLQINIVNDSDVMPRKEITIIKDDNVIHSEPYVVYGNIPYYITSPILHHFLYGVQLRPTVAVFTMQKEVADRILARDNQHTVLSLSCQLVARVEKVCDISPHNFTPVPKVWSTCLKFSIHWVEHPRAKEVLSLIKKWFSQKRKKLLTNLSQNGYQKLLVESSFHEMTISENVRAEELSLEKWLELFNLLHQQT